MRKNERFPPGSWLIMLSLVLLVSMSTTQVNGRPRAGILIGDNTMHSQFLQVSNVATASMR